MFAAASVVAEQRMDIGSGRLFNNDFIGDGADRWRTGSYVYSRIRAPRAFGAESAFGELLEYRLRGEIIASDPSAVAPGDRPYVGALSFGVHTHFDYGSALVSLGVDATAIGPQTGMSRFQAAFHDRLGMPEPVFTDGQLGDAVYLGGTAAVTTSIDVAPSTALRPFIEAQIGVEDTLRVGGDLIFGPVGQAELLLRDVVTGQLYRATDNGETGFSFVVGGDIAAVGDSVYLPQDRGVTPNDLRKRARAGVHYQHREGVSFFYGLTYLGGEFQGQSDGQVIGSLKLNFNF